MRPAGDYTPRARPGTASAGLAPFVPLRVQFVIMGKQPTRDPVPDDISPPTLQVNIEGAIEHFSEKGLTLPMYLKAAIMRPQLFYRCSAMVQGNIEGVVEHFSKEGLTLPVYLKAAVKQPPLFSQSPAIMQGNIEGVVEHFSEEGLTLLMYLKAAISGARPVSRTSAHQRGRTSTAKAPQRLTARPKGEDLGTAVGGGPRGVPPSGRGLRLSPRLPRGAHHGVGSVVLRPSGDVACLAASGPKTRMGVSG